MAPSTRKAVMIRRLAPKGEPESVRRFLLSEVLRFAECARECPGVRRIALVGSLARDKDDPKDADVLVTVDEDATSPVWPRPDDDSRGGLKFEIKGPTSFLPIHLAVTSVASAIGASAGRVCGPRATPVTVGAGPSCTTILTP